MPLMLFICFAYVINPATGEITGRYKETPRFETLELCRSFGAMQLPPAPEGMKNVAVCMDADGPAGSYGDDQVS